MTRVIQTLNPGILWVLVAPDVTYDDSWIGIPYTDDPDGDIVVSMQLADVNGTIPDMGVLGRLGNVLTLGDGATVGGLRIVGSPIVGSRAGGSSCHFLHTLTLDQWRKAAKFTYTKSVTGPLGDITVGNGATHFRCVRWDGATGPITAAPNLTTIAQADWGAIQNSTYTGLKLPKFGAIYPCNSAGVVTGDIITLDLNSSELTSFDATGLTSLTLLFLSSNKLTSFDATGLYSLSALSISNNQLTSFDATGLPLLTHLNLFDNQLTSFYAEGLTLLTVLDLYDNQLTSVYVSELGASSNISTYDLINLQNNALDADALNAFYTSLPIAVGGSNFIYVDGNPGTTSDDPSIATIKNYSVSGT